MPGSQAPAPLKPGVVCITNTGDLCSHHLFKENDTGFQAGWLVVFFFFYSYISKAVLHLGLCVHLAKEMHLHLSKRGRQKACQD